MHEPRDTDGQDGPRGLKRREVLAAGLGSALLLGARPLAASNGDTSMRTRPIPRTGEQLPVIGMGSWQTFDVGSNPKERAPLREVLERFFDAGARLIDSSPMYGRSEAVMGELLTELKMADTPFLATKVLTTGRKEGVRQMETSLQQLGHGRMDLMQVHNLMDVRTHLATLREWKAAKRIRYIGVTHYNPAAFGEMERLMREEKLDFVQLPYSLARREAETRLLGVARDTGTAVLVMRPFEEGALFRHVSGKPLPPWAADFDCTSWAQFFLKFILGHPAVNCPIPATSKPTHLMDNLRAGFGRLPDAKTRARMIAYLGL